MIFGFKISKNYAIDISLFTKIRQFADGIDFFELAKSIDWYKGDHKPSFRIGLIIFNIMIFELEAYNINHIKEE